MKISATHHFQNVVWFLVLHVGHSVSYDDADLGYRCSVSPGDREDFLVHLVDGIRSVGVGFSVHQTVNDTLDGGFVLVLVESVEDRGNIAEGDDGESHLVLVDVEGVNQILCELLLLLPSLWIPTLDTSRGVQSNGDIGSLTGGF